MTADITLRGPGDVVAILPYQLGYHPHDSVVVVSLRGRLVGLVARADLPPAEHADTAAAWLVGPLLRDGATSVIVIGYEDVADASIPVLLAVCAQLERAGVDVVDMAVVRDGRRYSPRCPDPCCPPEGVPLPEPADVPGVLEYVAMGRSPLASRDAVEQVVAPDPVASRGVGDAVASRAGMPRRRRRRRRSAAAWSTVLRRGGGDAGSGRSGARSYGARLRSGPPVAPGVIADLVLGLHDIAWRDGLIAWLAPGILSVQELDERVVELLWASLPTWGGMGFDDEDDGTRAGRDDLLQRLLALCRSVPDDCPSEAAALCTVASHVAWVSGDGAVARAAVERALRLDPGYRLAGLLAGLIDRGVRLPAPHPDEELPGAMDRAC